MAQKKDCECKCPCEPKLEETHSHQIEVGDAVLSVGDAQAAPVDDVVVPGLREDLVHLPEDQLAANADVAESTLGLGAESGVLVGTPGDTAWPYGQQVILTEGSGLPGEVGPLALALPGGLPRIGLALPGSRQAAASRGAAAGAAGHARRGEGASHEQPDVEALSFGRGEPPVPTEQTGREALPGGVIVRSPLRPEQEVEMRVAAISEPDPLKRPPLATGGKPSFAAGQATVARLASSDAARAMQSEGVREAQQHYDPGEHAPRPAADDPMSRPRDVLAEKGAEAMVLGAAAFRQRFATGSEAQLDQRLRERAQRQAARQQQREGQSGAQGDATAGGGTAASGIAATANAPATETTAAGSAATSSPPAASATSSPSAAGHSLDDLSATRTAAPSAATPSAGRARAADPAVVNTIFASENDVPTVAPAETAEPSGSVPTGQSPPQKRPPIEPPRREPSQGGLRFEALVGGKSALLLPGPGGRVRTRSELPRESPAMGDSLVLPLPSVAPTTSLRPGSASGLGVAGSGFLTASGVAVTATPLSRSNASISRARARLFQRARGGGPDLERGRLAGAPMLDLSDGGAPQNGRAARALGSLRSTEPTLPSRDAVHPSGREGEATPIVPIATTRPSPSGAAQRRFDVGQDIESMTPAPQPVQDGGRRGTPPQGQLVTSGADPLEGITGAGMLGGKFSQPKKSGGGGATQSVADESVSHYFIDEFAVGGPPPADKAFKSATSQLAGAFTSLIEGGFAAYGPDFDTQFSGAAADAAASFGKQFAAAQAHYRKSLLESGASERRADTAIAEIRRAAIETAALAAHKIRLAEWKASGKKPPKPKFRDTKKRVGKWLDDAGIRPIGFRPDPPPPPIDASGITGFSDGGGGGAGSSISDIIVTMQEDENQGRALVPEPGEGDSEECPCPEECECEEDGSGGDEGGGEKDPRKTKPKSGRRQDVVDSAVTEAGKMLIVPRTRVRRVLHQPTDEQVSGRMQELRVRFSKLPIGWRPSDDDLRHLAKLELAREAQLHFAQAHRARIREWSVQFEYDPRDGSLVVSFENPMMPNHQLSGFQEWTALMFEDQPAEPYKRRPDDPFGLVGPEMWHLVARHPDPGPYSELSFADLVPNPVQMLDRGLTEDYVRGEIEYEALRALRRNTTREGILFEGTPLYDELISEARRLDRWHEEFGTGVLSSFEDEIRDVPIEQWHPERFRHFAQIAAGKRYRRAQEEHLFDFSLSVLTLGIAGVVGTVRKAGSMARRAFAQADATGLGVGAATELPGGGWVRVQGEAGAARAFLGVGKGAPAPSGPPSGALRRQALANARSPWFRAKAQAWARATGKGRIDWDAYVTRLQSAEFREFATAREAGRSLGYSNVTESGEWIFGVPRALRRTPVVGDSAVQHELFHALQDMQTGLFTKGGSAASKVGRAVASEYSAHLWGSPVIGVPFVWAPTAGGLGYVGYEGYQALQDDE